MQKVIASEDYLVFISHSSKDRWIARQMARLIEERDIRTFFDEKDFQGGDRIPETIKKNIKECEELLVLLSSASVQSDWVKYEIAVAWALDKKLVPIVDKLSPEQMPVLPEQVKAVDLNDFDNYLNNLVERAKRTAR